MYLCPEYDIKLPSYGEAPLLEIWESVKYSFSAITLSSTLIWSGGKC